PSKRTGLPDAAWKTVGSRPSKITKVSSASEGAGAGGGGRLAPGLAAIATGLRADGAGSATVWRGTEPRVNRIAASPTRRRRRTPIAPRRSLILADSDISLHFGGRKLRAECAADANPRRTGPAPGSTSSSSPALPPALSSRSWKG